MSEDNFKFDPEDLPLGDNDGDSGGGLSSDSSGSSVLTNMSLTSVPISVAGLFAFLEKSATLAAIQSFLGTGGLALVITEALWVIGALSVGIIVTVGAIGVIALFLGLAQRSVVKMVIGLIIGAYYVGSAVIGITVFSSLPFLIGLTLGATVLLYGGIIVLAIVGGVLGLALM